MRCVELSDARAWDDTPAPWRNEPILGLVAVLASTVQRAHYSRALGHGCNLLFVSSDSLLPLRDTNLTWKDETMNVIGRLATISALVLAVIAPSAQAQTFTALHQFDSPADG